MGSSDPNKAAHLKLKFESIQDRNWQNIYVAGNKCHFLRHKLLGKKDPGNSQKMAGRKKT